MSVHFVSLRVKLTIVPPELQYQSQSQRGLLLHAFNCVQYQKISRGLAQSPNLGYPAQAPETTSATSSSAPASSSSSVIAPSVTVTISSSDSAGPTQTHLSGIAGPAPIDPSVTSASAPTTSNVIATSASTSSIVIAGPRPTDLDDTSSSASAKSSVFARPTPITPTKSSVIAGPRPTDSNGTSVSASTESSIIATSAPTNLSVVVEPTPTNSSVVTGPTATDSNVTGAPVPTNPTTIQASEVTRPVSTLVPAIIGSMIGALLLSIGVFLYRRRRNRGRRPFHKITPLTDIEEIAAIQPTRHLSQSQKQALVIVSDPDSSEKPPLPRAQSLESQHLDHENHENPSMGDDDDVRSQVAEIRATVDRMVNSMMEQVQRLEAQMGSGRERDSANFSTLDGHPPTYVSS
ncbi:hypothetical protein D9757_012991 [Collybiopsis confluens]|uniref:Uncharacterized protein n=1 Tax=Collybiopsis confluens TaxID=2823264 RepID=A0A8H5LQ97_9AGAR|nr:hypothetical protein D9757_012991 [Collybiopsis confluens]